jgi:catechol 2,3-dioxygenase-like lactoylglutathione lyase family enzyme
MLNTRIPAFLTALLLIGVCFAQSNEKKIEAQQQQQPVPAASAAEPQKGRVLGIGGIFFKSDHPGPMREWYAKNLGLSGQGGEAILHWREKDNPQQERMTVWSIFPANSKYFEPSQLMVNYIVDDLDAMLERLSKAGVKIDPKRQNAPYGRFAWVYDPDGNKIELWQPLDPAKQKSN